MMPATPCRRRQSASGCTQGRRTSSLGCAAKVASDRVGRKHMRPQSAGAACSAVASKGEVAGGGVKWGQNGRVAGTERLALLQQHHERQLKTLQQLHIEPAKAGGCMPLWVTTGHRSTTRTDQLIGGRQARPQSAGLPGVRRQAVGQRPWIAGYGRYASSAEAVADVGPSLQNWATGSKEGVAREGAARLLELPDSILCTTMCWSLASALAVVAAANASCKRAVQRAVRQILRDDHGLGSDHNIHPLRQLHLVQQMTCRRTSRMAYLRGPVVLTHEHCTKEWWADENTWLLSPARCLVPPQAASIVSVACGRNHLLLLDRLGSLWGLGDSRAAGVTPERELLQPTLVQAMQGVRLAKVACGNGHSVAISSGIAGDVFLWGRSLIHGGSAPWLPPNPRQGLAGEAVDISAGDSHVAAASLAGDTYVWGHNHHGQCARDPVVSTLSSPVRAVHALDDVVSRRVACGRYHTAVLSADGSLFTFGASMSGQLGRQSGWPLGPSWQPEKVSFHGDASDAYIAQIACGDEHTLCLSDKGRLFVFGCGDHGQLGLGGVRSHRAPTAVRIFKRVAEIAAGGSWSLIRTHEGRVHLAGRGEDDPDKDCRLLKQIAAPC